ncbi:MAG: glycosyltransferase family 4 protein [Chloroflexi bacterium]|nr:glycosyltransferase family 4 protein [Chloroflexota bacterium]
MKIGLVCPYDYAVPGGVQDHVRHLGTRFQQLGHDVRIIAPSSSDGVQTAGNLYTVGAVASVPANGSIARISVSIRLAKRVKHILQVECFDVVHIHEPLVPMLPITVLRLSEALTIGTFHAYSDSNYGYRWGKPLLKRYVKRLAGCITVSEVAQQFVEHYFPGHYTVIPNGIDTREFLGDIAPLPQFADGKLNILFFGRIEKRKGLRYLLRAFPLVKSAFPNARLIIAGEGAERPAYQRWVGRQGFSDVVFTGRVPAEDRARYFASADIFCAPNIGGESFGLVLLEAMASGKPVIASAIPGYQSVIRDGVDGVLVPPKQSEALASAICRLLGDPDRQRRLGTAGRLKALQYDWDFVADRVLAYYRSVAQARQEEVKRLVASPAEVLDALRNRSPAGEGNA